MGASSMMTPVLLILCLFLGSLVTAMPATITVQASSLPPGPLPSFPGGYWPVPPTCKKGMVPVYSPNIYFDPCDVPTCSKQDPKITCPACNKDEAQYHVDSSCICHEVSKKGNTQCETYSSVLSKLNTISVTPRDVPTAALPSSPAPSLGSNLWPVAPICPKGMVPQYSETIFFDPCHKPTCVKEDSTIKCPACPKKEAAYRIGTFCDCHEVNGKSNCGNWATAVGRRDVPTEVSSRHHTHQSTHSSMPHHTNSLHHSMKSMTSGPHDTTEHMSRTMDHWPSITEGMPPPSITHHTKQTTGEYAVRDLPLIDGETLITISKPTQVVTWHTAHPSWNATAPGSWTKNMSHPMTHSMPAHSSRPLYSIPTGTEAFKTAFSSYSVPSSAFTNPPRGGPGPVIPCARKHNCTLSSWSTYPTHSSKGFHNISEASRTSRWLPPHGTGVAPDSTSKMPLPSWTNKPPGVVPEPVNSWTHTPIPHATHTLYNDTMKWNSTHPRTHAPIPHATHTFNNSMKWNFTYSKTKQTPGRPTSTHTFYPDWFPTPTGDFSIPPSSVASAKSIPPPYFSTYDSTGTTSVIAIPPPTGTESWSKWSPTRVPYTAPTTAATASFDRSSFIASVNSAASTVETLASGVISAVESMTTNSA